MQSDGERQETHPLNPAIPDFKSREANFSLVSSAKNYPVYLSTSKKTFRKKASFCKRFYSIMFLI